ncbi:MAG: tetratricopeptide repeat protein [Pseudonocardia sp.]
MAEVQLDAEVRRDLRGLRKEVAEDVSRHLVAAGTLLEDDPERALEHARYARSRASRLAVVREAVGLAAYRAGEWSEAIAELRAARRMGGGPGHLPVLADAERALGRPERALELSRGPEARALNREDSIELLMVVSGARRDLGELDAAVVGLQIPELDPAKPGPWSARLFYAYADALLAAGRRDESIRWFLNAAQADQDELTDATERLGQLSVDPSVVAHGQSPGDATADPAGASEEDASADPAGEVPPEPGSRPAVDTSC